MIDTEITSAAKVAKVRGAMEQLRREYAGRPDVEHILTEALDLLPVSSFALLYDLLAAHDTAAAARASLETA